MITQRHMQHDGDRVLWRVAIDDVVALDVLTDLDHIARVRAAIATDSSQVITEQQLGSFGPFAVTVSISEGNPDQAYISVDGPDLGRAFHGDQSIVFYLDRQDLLGALTVD